MKEQTCYAFLLTHLTDAKKKQQNAVVISTTHELALEELSLYFPDYAAALLFSTKGENLLITQS